ncbi:MAG: sulfotransferase family 2 domain-containing protein [Alphaproteobacteria bacterium]|nr:sulfotransferase family 2 domain-containing protein [Alphaproteobacteria bacterium]
MISHDHRCIFVHIPKTGGSNIENVIWPHPRSESDLWMGFVQPFRNKYQTGGLQHLQARQMRQEVSQDAFRRYFKFSIVRNPWDKAVSQCAYLKKRPDLCDYLGIAADAPFEQ